MPNARTASNALDSFGGANPAGKVAAIELVAAEPVAASGKAKGASPHGMDRSGMVGDETHREFVRLITQNQRPLYRYILSLVPNWNDADEILQETHLRLWEEFDKYEPGTNFGAWARKVAYYQMLTWRKKASRSKLLFDPQLVSELSAQMEETDEAADLRREALTACIGELSDRHRDLLSKCYAEGAKIREVALALGRTPAAIYKTIQRLRLSLHDCIERKLEMDRLKGGRLKGGGWEEGRLEEGK